jgi:glycosyltransferase involved in cell wall biosynthesis
MNTTSLPFLSVIVPAHQGAKVLPHSLAALEASDLPRECWELIVVDDASHDDTSLIAARYADTVIRLPGTPNGPAYARNRGFEASRGEILVFIDADVAVHTDTLRRFALLFAHDAELGAAFGSYDPEPVGPGLVSQYRNLLHHYVHQQSVGEAETFWAGCGAIRRDVFRDVGLFDEWHFPRPQIEDIELGRRIRRSGYRVLLRPEIQATHLKEWTFRQVVTTDFTSRGVPWMRLLLQEGRSAASQALNLSIVAKLCTALVGLGLAALVAALLLQARWALLLAGVAFLVVVLLNAGFYTFLWRVRGAWFTLRAIPLHLLYYFINGLSAISGWALHHLVGAPRPSHEVAARSAMGVKTWPPTPARPTSSVWTASTGKADRATTRL